MPQRIINDAVRHIGQYVTMLPDASGYHYILWLHSRATTRGWGCNKRMLLTYAAVCET
jgi:hypothetical protein